HPILYEKFSAKHRKFFGNDCLWFGQDHLLLVSSTGISEDYKRFYYKDIQAIQLMKTKARLARIIITFILLGITGAITALACSMDKSNPAVLVSSGIMGLFLIGCLVRLFIKGPFCKTFIYSSVQKEKLTPLNTVKKSALFLSIITPKIKAWQGQMTPDMLRSDPRRMTAAPGAILQHAANIRQKIISPVWHRGLFLSLLCLSVLMTTLLLFRAPVLFAVFSLALLLILLTNTAALVKQAGSTLSAGVKATTIASMIFLVLTIGAGYVEFVFFMIKNVETWAKASQNQWEMAKLYARINPFDYPVILGLDIFLICVFFITGLTGLIFLWRQKK
ncbi:MAG: hypothetical protein KJ760_12490, partial [Proteobacteria bacterium]|nr:hypothetical protein [Pseudomonadota bacterium]